MRVFILVIIVLLTSLSSVSGRNICGVVSDENGEGLPYSVIKIKNKNFGILSDSIGSFMLSSGKLSYQDTLQISYLSYNPEEIALSEIPVDTVLNVCLKPNPMTLKEVIARPRKMKVKTVGKHHKGGLMKLTMNGGCEKGESFGYEFRAKGGKSQYLDKVGFYIIDEGAKTMARKKFRVNIYDMSKVDKEPTREFVNIMSKPIIFEFRKEDIKDGKYTYTLPQLIKLPPEAMVEIEFLESLENDEIWNFKGNLVGKNNWGKVIGQDFWIKHPFAMPFFLQGVEL